MERREVEGAGEGERGGEREVEWGRVGRRVKLEGGRGNKRQIMLVSRPSRIKTKVRRLQVLAGPAETSENFSRLSLARRQARAATRHVSRIGQVAREPLPSPTTLPIHSIPPPRLS